MQSRARRRYGADDTGDSFAVITIGSDGTATSASSSGTSQHHHHHHHHQRVEDDIPEKPKYPAPSSATSWLPALSQRIFASVAPAPTNPAPRSAWNEPPPKQQQHQGFWASEGQREAEEDDDDDLLGKNSALPEFTMTARDRSGEFASAIRSLQGRNIQRAVNLKDPRKAKHMQSYAEFMMIAKHIGKNIASTYTKLEKLTLLAKKKTLFDDRPAEIQELTYIIKGDLNSLNQQIARLQEVSKSQRRSTSNGKHLLSHSSNMVVALQAKLANMSSDFKQVLEVRTENLKQQKTRRDQFSQGPMAGGLPPSTMRGSTQGSLLLQEQQDQVCIDMGGAGPSGGSSSERAPLLQQQQQQQLVLYDESDSYVQERAETMQNIESTIVELGGIFQQLAHMVKEQEEMVERIDSNLQDVELNVEAAHGEILKYFQSVTKNRWLMIKIFGVLILFFIFFVIFLA
ncbi:syntaxin-5 [Anopheles merus]|uniref:t-SNARE coiled-coil homology domain-containing protein n=1 Tax=Anopheles merus TaxID=30066 RepID=A0A182VCS8_ANOME|nr:syntaxin-5 [Anopheles merus]